MLQRAVHRGDGRIGQRRGRIGGRVAGREEKLVAIAQRQLKGLGQAYDHGPAGSGPTALHEAHVPLGGAGPVRELELAHPPQLPPVSQRRWKVHPVVVAGAVMPHYSRQGIADRARPPDDRVMDDDVRFGVVLPTGLPRGADPGGLLDLAVRAEALGFASVWVGETLLRPVLEPLTFLAAVAARTDRIGIGTAAMLPAFRRPVQAAQALASLDRLSHGRLTIGVGAGFPQRSEVEYAVSDVPWRRRFAR